ncbi:unnamed protein product [[Candida] boidinii]|uniref:Unnamed protein product n=1 Tax=Candida boidinii TaxID=5477 RepID=A0A9W6WK98_CANBO|nr:unnamed protein product [[Candida] boidinii]
MRLFESSVEFRSWANKGTADVVAAAAAVDDDCDCWFEMQEDFCSLSFVLQDLCIFVVVAVAAAAAAAAVDDFAIGHEYF